ncbi:MAG: hypothetical protein ACHQWU_04845, partial [Gemmatimonadales bacterium]
MITPTPARVGAIAAASLLLVTGCAPGTLGVSPETVIATVIANLPAAIPASTTTTSSRSGRSAPTRPVPSSPPPSAEASRILRTGDSYR